MQRQARRDTGLEMGLRRRLHARGLRYRVQVPLLPRRTVDIVFTRRRVAIDVRACFWHACPEHGGVPKANHEWWDAKLRRNAERDQCTVRALTDAGWRVIVVWEHDDLDATTDCIEAAVRTPAGS